MPRNTLLVVAAHPDDEVLGCGATVALRVQQKWQAHLVVVATGITGRYAKPDRQDDVIEGDMNALKEDIDRAADILGFSNWTCLDFPDNRLDTVSRMDIAHALKEVVGRIQPGVVYTHHPGDYNWDHGRTFDAVLMACRTNPGDFAPEQIYS